ncbi:protein phosphatase 1 regulatory subunit 35-like [Cuculus canorus]|uniref:protein phosphatase 1 regulatory subunit 35-like n=1 Tax=Cuculus canorus TaxID=55661 RepID=UPI0023AB4A7E|nr:protein phosphatase 1 regulatory subunit 35-like [Cuculus canorus]
MRPPEAVPPRGGILRRGERGGGPRQVRFELEPAGHAGKEADWEAPPPPPLGTPSLHSSRGGAAPPPPPPFDAPRAAAERLGGSFRARCAVGGAAGAINVPPTHRLFHGLISLTVPPRPEPRRGVLPPTLPPNKDPGPEVMALAGGAGKGQGGPLLPPFAPPEPPRPLPSPPKAIFLMYRKLQQWGVA